MPTRSVYTAIHLLPPAALARSSTASQQPVWRCGHYTRSSLLDMAEPSAEEHWSFAPLGDAGLLVLVHGSLDRSVVYELADVLRQQPPAGVVELVCAVDSVLICFDPLATTAGTLRRAVRKLLSI